MCFFGIHEDPNGDFSASARAVRGSRPSSQRRSMAYEDVVLEERVPPSARVGIHGYGNPYVVEVSPRPSGEVLPRTSFTQVRQPPRRPVSRRGLAPPAPGLGAPPPAPGFGIPAPAPALRIPAPLPLLQIPPPSPSLPQPRLPVLPLAPMPPPAAYVELRQAREVSTPRTPTTPRTPSTTHSNRHSAHVSEPRASTSRDGHQEQAVGRRVTGAEDRRSTYSRSQGSTAGSSSGVSGGTRTRSQRETPPTTPRTGGSRSDGLRDSRLLEEPRRHRTRRMAEEKIVFDDDGRRISQYRYA